MFIHDYKIYCLMGKNLEVLGKEIIVGNNVVVKLNSPCAATLSRNYKSEMIKIS